MYSNLSTCTILKMDEKKPIAETHCFCQGVSEETISGCRTEAKQFCRNPDHSIYSGRNQSGLICLGTCPNRPDTPSSKKLHNATSAEPLSSPKSEYPLGRFRSQFRASPLEISLAYAAIIASRYYPMRNSFISPSILCISARGRAVL